MKKKKEKVSLTFPFPADLLQLIFIANLFFTFFILFYNSVYVFLVPLSTYFFFFWRKWRCPSMKLDHQKVAHQLRLSLSVSILILMLKNKNKNNIINSMMIISKNSRVE